MHPSVGKGLLIEQSNLVSKYPGSSTSATCNAFLLFSLSVAHMPSISHLNSSHHCFLCLPTWFLYSWLILSENFEEISDPGASDSYLNIAIRPGKENSFPSESLSLSLSHSSHGSHIGQLDFCNWLADGSTTG